MDKKKFFDAVSDYILEHRPDVPHAADTLTITSVPATENLFDLGLVDSRAMLDLLTFVEELTDREVDVLNIDISRLFTLEGIYGVVFDIA